MDRLTQRLVKCDKRNLVNDNIIYALMYTVLFTIHILSNLHIIV